MISRALFIIVAESTVIFGPMSQVGCASASAIVTPAQLLARVIAERAAAGREHDASSPHAAGPPATPETRRCVRYRPAGFALALRGQLHDQRAGHDQRFFIGQRHGLAGLECRPGAAQARAADDRGQRLRRLRAAGQCLPAPRSHQSARIPLGKTTPILPGGGCRVSWRRPSEHRTRLLAVPAGLCVHEPTGPRPVIALPRPRSPPTCSDQCCPWNRARRCFLRGPSYFQVAGRVVILRTPEPIGPGAVRKTLRMFGASRPLRSCRIVADGFRRRATPSSGSAGHHRSGRCPTPSRKLSCDTKALCRS